MKGVLCSFTIFQPSLENTHAWPGLSIYGNLLIESVSSVFHFRRVPFFNGIKKKLYFSFENHFRRVPFFNGIKKKLYFSFESPWRISRSPNDVPLPFTAFLLDRCRLLSMLEASLQSWSSQDALPNETRHTIWTFHYSPWLDVFWSCCCPLPILHMLWLWRLF